MWFGTDEKLNRYDGKYFRTYSHNIRDSNSLSTKIISGVLAAEDGKKYCVVVRW